jgi:dethiobiotin synthetase
MNAVFVTSSGTEVGKTFVATGLVRELRARGVAVDALKPVISGWDESRIEDSDTGRLLRALGRPVDVDGIQDVSPWRFAAPLSPDMAAAREQRRVDWDELLRLCQARVERGSPLLVEGIGGVMVPLDDTHTVLDWIASLRLPTLLVVGSYLGSLSHTLTAAAALLSRDVVTHLVISESETSPVSLDETAATLARHLPGMGIWSVPRGGTGRSWAGEILDRLWTPA